MNDKMTTFDFTLNYKQIDFDIIMELILLCKYVYPRTTASDSEAVVRDLSYPRYACRSQVILVVHVSLSNFDETLW